MHSRGYLFTPSNSSGPSSHTFKHTIPLGQPKPPALPDLSSPPKTLDPPDSPNSPISPGSPEPPDCLTHHIYLIHHGPVCPTDPPNHTAQTDHLLS